MPTTHHPRKRRKRPCRVCRKWFHPDPRVKDRQKTCGDPACQREWHRRLCAKWNQTHRHLVQEDRLAARLEDGPKESPRSSPQLPISLLKDEIGPQHTVITVYIARLLFRPLQDELRVQRAEINSLSQRLFNLTSQDEMATSGPGSIPSQDNRPP